MRCFRDQTRTGLKQEKALRLVPGLLVLLLVFWLGLGAAAFGQADPPPPAASEVATELSTEISLRRLVLSAHWLVQGVMGLLVLMSLASWTIWIQKTLHLGRVKRRTQVFQKAFWKGTDWQVLQENAQYQKDPAGRLFAAAMEEWNLSMKESATELRPLLERIRMAIQLAIDKDMELLNRHVSFLATVGVTAPFIGLFGTVWGVMNAFQSIALTAQTSLAAVAPGMAEALLATGLGLGAAIPATMFYNRLQARITLFGGGLERFGESFIILLSRHFGRKTQA